VGDTVLMRDRWASVGYLSQASDELHFGLGDAEVVDQLTVRWPNGNEEVWEQIPVDQRIVLTEGASEQGSLLPPPPALALENTAGGVRVSWTVEGESSADEFVIYRNQSGRWAARLAVVPAQSGVTAYEYVDEMLQPETVFEYRVMARHGGVAVTSDRADLETSAMVRSSRGGRPIPRPETFAPDDAPVQPAIPANVPNPFNPGTTIYYEVPGPAASQVQLRIFDSGGRLVVELINEVVDPGRWEEPWDGRDSTGRGVGSGVYYVRLEVAGHDAVYRKLALVR
jgi:hypothetical protein